MSYTGKLKFKGTDGNVVLFDMPTKLKVRVDDIKVGDTNRYYFPGGRVLRGVVTGITIDADGSKLLEYDLMDE
jgi:hypothetical protein